MSELTLTRKMQELKRKGFNLNSQNAKLDAVISVIEAMYAEFYDAPTDIPSNSITMGQLPVGLLNHDNIVIVKVSGIDLMTLGQTELVPAQTGKKFIHFNITPLVTVTAYDLDGGAAGVDPVVQIGQTASFNEIVDAASGTIAQSGLSVGDVFPLTLETLAVLDIGTNGIELDVQTAGTITSGSGGELIIAEVTLIGFII